MKKLFTLASLAFVFVLFSSLQIMAQRTVSGTITDSNGESLIGANVLEKGTSNGTITDIDGTYSLTVSEGAVLMFSFTGYTVKEMAVGNSSVIDITLDEGELLDEIVVTGYGSQRAKEVTSSVVKLDREDFNQGAISDPAQLLQGKVAGLQVYNRGGNPNQASTIRLRGISTVGANAEPLIVIDGIIGASLDNVDPNDILDVNVLKDGSAAAIYGSRGSSGVIIVTTRQGSKTGKVDLSYNGQVAVASPMNGINILSAQDFVAAGGTDLGNATDWVDEVTRTGITQIHNVAASGGTGNTTFRVSANLREVDGILKNSGFDQFNTRLNFGTRALNDKLKIDFNTSFTDREQQNGFNEALRYAIIYNPTAPVLGANSPFPFNSPQFGGYFETLGLFDSFNPVSIIEQNRNEGKRREFNYGANFNYSITDNFSANLRIAEQSTSFSNMEYYPTTSLFRGGATSPTRKGLANLYNSSSSFKLYEMYGTYLANFGNVEATFTGGYSFQQQNFSDQFVGIGDFPNNDLNFANAIENAQDLLNAGFIGANSNATPDEKIIAFFGRANFSIDNGIYINASLRQEGSTKLGEGNKWGLFPSIGVGVDLNNYLSLNNVDQLKVRLGYGVTGALPNENGLSREIRRLNYDPNTGAANTSLSRLANPDLKWEEKKETNLGVDFSAGKLSGSVDVYNRDIEDFILSRALDAAANNGATSRIENAGKLNTKGFEVALNYDLIDNASTKYTTGVVLSSYKSTLQEYVLPAESRGELGAPGQNGTRMLLVRVGEEIGNIWGPRFTGVADNGTPIFADINGDGVIIDGQDKALDPDVDFEVLGNGIPDLELGWNNRIQVGNWSINAFFRGAFGHSLVNTFRAFYEPRLSTQSSYNYVTTDLAEPGLTAARFSSLYVEKADFFKLDNLTVSRRIDLPSNSAFKSLNISLIAQNPLVLTSYTGTDPEPSLVDSGPADNGGASNGADVLSPGIDRRNNYFASRSITLGINVNF